MIEITIRKLAEAADALEGAGLSKEAAVLDKAASTALQFKKAQYLGVQGYWVRNGRCWKNCYRDKRASSPKMPAQRVWEECWEEYKESLHSVDKGSDGWNKYASKEDSGRVPRQKEMEQYFVKNVTAEVDNGMPLDVAINYVSENNQYDRLIDLLRATAKVADVMDSIKLKDTKALTKFESSVKSLSKFAQQAAGANGAPAPQQGPNQPSSFNQAPSYTGEIADRSQSGPEVGGKFDNGFIRGVQRMFGGDQNYQRGLKDKARNYARQQIMQRVLDNGYSEMYGNAGKDMNKKRQIMRNLSNASEDIRRNYINMLPKGEREQFEGDRAPRAWDEFLYGTLKQTVNQRNNRNYDSSMQSDKRNRSRQIEDEDRQQGYGVQNKRLDQDGQLRNQRLQNRQQQEMGNQNAINDRKMQVLKSLGDMGGLRGPLTSFLYEGLNEDGTFKPERMSDLQNAIRSLSVLHNQMKARRAPSANPQTNPAQSPAATAPQPAASKPAPQKSPSPRAKRPSRPSSYQKPIDRSLSGNRVPDRDFDPNASSIDKTKKTGANR
jgi:hypothetical protein